MIRIKELEAHLQKWEARSNNGNELETAKLNLIKTKNELEECLNDLHDRKSSEANVCQKELENKMERNIYLQNEKSKLQKTLGESRLNASTIQKQVEDCEANLAEKNDEHEILQTSFLKNKAELIQLKTTLSNQKNQTSHKNCDELEEYICSINFPVWSEWSNCSNDLCSTKTRMNVCKNGDEQIRQCYENAACPDSGEKLSLVFSLSNR